MATLEPDETQIKKGVDLLMGLLNSSGIGIAEGTYALALTNYLACKNSLAMTDADYMRFCETIMEWGQDMIFEATAPAQGGE